MKRNTNNYRGKVVYSRTSLLRRSPEALRARDEGWMNIMRLSLAVAGLLWLGAILGQAATNYVAQAGQPPSTNYLTWATASSNIQDAIDVASVGNTVLVSNGTYNLTNQISITKAVTVRSVNGTNFTFVNGNFPDYTNRCFYMTAGVLDGFTITNGCSTNSSGGGGIFINGASAAVYNCYIHHNVASNSSGGGIRIYAVGGGIVSNCAIVSNSCLPANSTALSGGGVCMYVGASLDGGLLADSYIGGNIAYQGGGVAVLNGGRVTNCTIAGNIATVNGGLYIQNVLQVSGNLVISNNTGSCGGGALYNGRLINSTIIANQSPGWGGGMYIYNGAFMSNCLVIGNRAASTKGGVYLSGSITATNMVANCIIASNSASSTCGGLQIDYGGVVRNCLIYGNTNGGSVGGAGVYLVNNALYTNPPYGLINCTIVDNRGNVNGAGIYAEGYSNYVENCIVVSNVNTAGAQRNVYNLTAANTNNYWHTCTPTNLVLNQGNITNDPLFVNQGNNNYRLAKSSPCINAGTNQAWMSGATDLDGRRRLDAFSGLVDMGCYEHVPEGTMYKFW